MFSELKLPLLIKGSHRSGKTKALVECALSLAKDGERSVLIATDSFAKRNLKKALCNSEQKIPEYNELITVLTCYEFSLHIHAVSSVHNVHGKPPVSIYPMQTIYSLIDSAWKANRKLTREKLNAKTVRFMQTSEREGWSDKEKEMQIQLWFSKDHEKAERVIMFVENNLKLSNAVTQPMLSTWATQYIAENHTLDIGFDAILVDDAESLTKTDLGLLITAAEKRKRPNQICFTSSGEKHPFNWRGSDRFIKHELSEVIPSLKILDLDDVNARAERKTERTIGRKLGECARDGVAAHSSFGATLITSNHIKLEPANIFNHIRSVLKDGETAAIVYRNHYTGKILQEYAVESPMDIEVRHMGLHDHKMTLALNLVNSYFNIAANPMDGIAFVDCINKPSRRLGQTLVAELAKRKQESPKKDWFNITEELLVEKGAKQSGAAHLWSFVNDSISLQMVDGEGIVKILRADIDLNKWLEKQGEKDFCESFWDTMDKIIKPAKNLREAQVSLRAHFATNTVNDSNIILCHASHILNDEVDHLCITDVESGGWDSFDLEIYDSADEANHRAQVKCQIASVLTRAKKSVVFSHSKLRMSPSDGWTKHEVSPLFISLLADKNSSVTHSDSVATLDNGFKQGGLAPA